MTTNPQAYIDWAWRDHTSGRVHRMPKKSAGKGLTTDRLASLPLALQKLVAACASNCTAETASLTSYEGSIGWVAFLGRPDDSSTTMTVVSQDTLLDLPGTDKLFPGLAKAKLLGTAQAVAPYIDLFLYAPPVRSSGETADALDKKHHPSASGLQGHTGDGWSEMDLAEAEAEAEVETGAEKEITGKAKVPGGGGGASAGARKGKTLYEAPNLYVRLPPPNHELSDSVVSFVSHTYLPYIRSCCHPNCKASTSTWCQTCRHVWACSNHEETLVAHCQKCLWELTNQNMDKKRQDQLMYLERVHMDKLHKAKKTTK